MGDHRVRISFSPWDDASFHDTFERAMAVVCRSDVDLDARSTADAAEALLRADGYPSATIVYSRTFDDLMHACARWLVCRDGPARRLASMTAGQARPQGAVLNR